MLARRVNYGSRPEPNLEELRLKQSLAERSARRGIRTQPFRNHRRHKAFIPRCAAFVGALVHLGRLGAYWDISLDGSGRVSAALHTADGKSAPWFGRLLAVLFCTSKALTWRHSPFFSPRFVTT